MLQEQFDAMNPSACTCQHACDNSQLVLPTVVSHDEVAYRCADGIPFSPSRQKIVPSANPIPQSQIASATQVAPFLTSQSTDATMSNDSTTASCKVAIPAQPSTAPST